jgi:hypothetical protein
MAAKTKTDPSSMITNSTKAFEEASMKLQEQYFTMLEQGQASALEQIEAMADAVSKIDVPAVPGLDTVLPAFDVTTAPTNMYDGAFEFASKMLENQREFTTKVLAAGAKG